MALPMNPQSRLFGKPDLTGGSVGPSDTPGLRRLRASPLAEQLRLSTLEQQRTALAEAGARRTTGPADKARDGAPPATATDYPEMGRGYGRRKV